MQVSAEEVLTVVEYIPPVQIIHDHVQLAAVLERVVQPHHIRVFEHLHDVPLRLRVPHLRWQGEIKLKRQLRSDGTTQRGSHTFLFLTTCAFRIAFIAYILSFFLYRTIITCAIGFRVCKKAQSLPTGGRRDKEEQREDHAPCRNNRSR